MIPAARLSSASSAVKALFASVLALGLLFGAASAASAHDALESSSPADGSTVATVPDRITLTMSDTPGALGSEIKVLDAAGTNWAQGAVKVVDNLAIEQLRSGAPAGKYTVQWRLVSSDSHPIEGTFSFTAGGAAAGATGGATAGSNQGAAAGTAAPLVKGTEAAAPQAASSDGIPWSVIAMIVVLVALVAGLAIFAKRRLGSSED